MRIEQFAKDLEAEMEELIATADENINATETGKLASQLLDLATRLNDFINQYHFENVSEEIYFFKNIKPTLFSNVIYYEKLFEIQLHTPIGTTSEINSYYLCQLKNFTGFIQENRELLTYYRSGSTVLDEIYFTRKKIDLWLSLSRGHNNDPGITSVYDQKLSRLLAYEKLSSFMVHAIDKNQYASSVPLSTKGEPPIKWTASKASLIELLYALQTSGVCNNGTIDVKELAIHFENIFNVKLGNFYRTFQEIRIRKISRTSFLDQLRESLIKRMDDSDENPRY